MAMFLIGSDFDFYQNGTQQVFSQPDSAFLIVLGIALIFLILLVIQITLRLKSARLALKHVENRLAVNIPSQTTQLNDKTSPSLNIEEPELVKPIYTEKIETDAWVRTLWVGIEQTPVTTVITDIKGNIVFVNPKFTEITGYTAEEAIGQNPRILKTNDKTREEYKELWDTILSGQNWRGTFHNKKKDGTLYWESAVISPVTNEQGKITHFLAIKEDITERKLLEEKLEKQATTDDLTGLTNRRHFLDLARHEIKRALRLNHALSIALIDLDYFKHINDTYGHVNGDKTLLNFAQICQANIRDFDIFARFGGDEFILLLPEAEYQQAYEVVDRIRQTLNSTPIDIAGNPVFITISSGIARLENTEDSLDALIARADQALYQAKETGRNYVVLSYQEK